MSAFSDTLLLARYLSFGGCGTKGVAYLGCLKALQQHHAGHVAWHRQLRGTCGSSSGCVAALAFLVNADADCLIERWRALHVQSIVQYPDLNAVFSRYGVDGGEEVKRIIREVFAVCGLAHDTTFRTLQRLTNRDLRICVTNLNRARLELFSHITTPDVVVADAMYWSMTIPFVFQPETYRGDLMIDGCALSYVPYDVWPLQETVIFHARGINTGACTERRRDITDLRSFALGVLACCARSALRAVNELSRAHPERFLCVNVCDQDHDSTIYMNDATLHAIVNLGFATTLVRLFPELPNEFEQLLRMSIAMVMMRHPPENTQAASDMHDDM